MDFKITFPFFREMEENIVLTPHPIPILIPCHRVIGKGSSLTGYAGGVEKKEFLLKLEKR